MQNKLKANGIYLLIQKEMKTFSTDGQTTVTTKRDLTTLANFNGSGIKAVFLAVTGRAVSAALSRRRTFLAYCDQDS